MAKKIYVSPSDQDANVYAVGATNEMVQCQKISKALVAALKRCGFEAMENVSDSMEARVAESNRWGADLHISVHTNAFDGNVMGTRMMAYDLSGEGYRACEAILAALAPITPGTSDSVTARPGLYELRATTAPAAYTEVAFHDNPTEAQWIIDHIEEIAEAICKGVCGHYGYAYVAPAGGMLYRVQVGAFQERANAEAMLQALKADGYEGFVVTAQQ